MAINARSSITIVDLTEELYTVLLTNESQQFPTNSSRVPLLDESYYTDVIVYQGTTERTDYIIGEVPSANNITVTKTSSRVTFSVSTTSALPADSGTFIIPITIDGKTFNKIFNWSCVQQEEIGAEAKFISITASSQIFKSTDGGVTFLPETIVLTPLIYGGISYSKWQYSIDGGFTWTDIISGTHGLTITDGVLTIVKTSDLYTESVTIISFKCISNDPSYYDTITVLRLYDVTGLQNDLNSIQSQITTITESVSGVEAKVNANTKSITDKVWQSDINTSINDYDGENIKIIRDQVAEHTTAIGSITSGVSDIQSTLTTKADGSTVQELSSKVSTIEQDAEGFKKTVSTTYAKKSELDSSLETIQSSLTQTSNEIKQDVSDIEGNVTSMQQTLTSISQSVTNVQGDVSTLQQTAGGIEIRVSDAENAITSLQQDSDSIKLSVGNVEKKVDKSIKSNIEQFYSSTSPTSLDGGAWSDEQPTWTDGKYIWRRTKITYQDDTTEYTPSDSGVCITGNTGEKGDQGDSGISVTQVEVEYYLSTSNTTQSDGSWSTNVPDWVDGKYIWSRTKTTLSNGADSTTSPVCITGGKGTTGSSGTSVVNITTEFYLSSSKTEQIDGEWTETPPIWSNGKYLWTRSKIIYENPTSTDYTIPVCDNSWEVVNGIEVGGRNLLLSSDEYKANSEYPIATYIMSEKMVAGDIYTCRIWGTLGEGKTHFSLYLDGETISLAPMTDNNDGTYIVTFVGKDSTEEINDLNVYTMPLETVAESIIDKIKLEKGNKATDWTPAPEDVNSAVSNVNSKVDSTEEKFSSYVSQIEMLNNSIASLVIGIGENGEKTSLMTQTEEGWRFDISGFESSLTSSVDKLNGLSGTVENIEDNTNKLNELVSDIATKTTYITISQDEEGLPCIELGKEGDDFKVRITNHSVDFIQKDIKVAYISNQALYIEKAIIKNELQIGYDKGFIWKRRANNHMGLRWIGGEV